METGASSKSSPRHKGEEREGRERMACTIDAFFSMAYGLPLQVPPIRLRSAALLQFKIHEHQLHLFHPSGTEGLRLSTLPTDDHAERQPKAGQRPPLRFIPIDFKDEMRSPATLFCFPWCCGGGSIKVAATVRFCFYPSDPPDGCNFQTLPD